MPYNIAFSLLLLLPFHASLTILYIIILKKQFSRKSFNLLNNNFPRARHYSRHAMHQPASQGLLSFGDTYNPTTEISNLTKICTSILVLQEPLRHFPLPYNTLYQYYISSLGPFFLPPPRPIPSAILTSSSR